MCTCSEILDTEEAAQLLKLTPGTVRDLARQGQIPGRLVGHQWRFSKERLVAWIACQDVPHTSSSRSDGGKT